MKSIFVLAVLLLLAVPVTAFAEKGGKGKGMPVKQVKIDLNLIPAPVPPPEDLAAAAGVLHYKKNKGRTKLQAKVSVPLAAASLGIIDAVTAAAADIHLAISRTAEGQDPVVVDCKLEFAVPDEGEEAAAWEYKLMVVKNTPKAAVKEIKGDCDELLAPQTGDVIAVTGYAVVAEAQVPFLTNQ